MPQIACDVPRSTWSHCGSENCEAQRVPVFPSTAAEAGNVAFSSDEAVAGWFSATLVVPQDAALARDPVPALILSTLASSAKIRASARCGRRRRGSLLSYMVLLHGSPPNKWHDTGQA